MIATPTINAPTVPLDHADYLRQCEFSLEPSVRKLIQIATAAGWANDHVALSLARIAAQEWQEALHH